MAQKDFTRTKPHVNIATIGHVSHGKTTLASAISIALGRPRTYAEIAGKRGKVRSSSKILTVTADVFEYETPRRHYAHVDCPGHADFVRNMIRGASQADGAILVVSAVDGPMPQTREHILLARQVGVPAIVVAINMVDAAEPDVIDVVELEIRELLTRYGFPGDTLPVVRLSALAAVQGDTGALEDVRRLMNTVDDYVPLPVPLDDKPFLMPIEGVQSVPGIGTVATGRIERGRLRPGDAVEVVGLADTSRSTVCRSLQAFHRPLAEGQTGDSVGVLLRGVARDELRTGQVLAVPGSVRAYTTFTARVYVLTREEGGRHTPFFSGYRPQFFFRTTDVTGDTQLMGGVEMCLPGDHVEVEVTLQRPVALEEQLTFSVREGGKTVAAGKVITVVR